MLNLLLGLIVFTLTMGESYVSSRERSAEMLVGLAISQKDGNVPDYRLARRMAHRSARWALAFETILCVWLFVGLENKWLMLLAIPGAYAGQWWAQERRIRKAERR